MLLFVDAGWLSLFQEDMWQHSWEKPLKIPRCKTSPNKHQLNHLTQTRAGKSDRTSRRGETRDGRGLASLGVAQKASLALRSLVRLNRDRRKNNQWVPRLSLPFSWQRDQNPVVSIDSTRTRGSSRNSCLKSSLHKWPKVKCSYLFWLDDVCEFVPRSMSEAFRRWEWGTFL